MRLDITGRHVDITPALRQLIDRRSPSSRASSTTRAISATVILTKEKYRHMAEIVIHARGDHMLRGIGEGNTWPLSFRQASQKIEQQAQTLKASGAKASASGDTAKSRGAAGAGAPARADAARRAPTRYAVKPMSVEDAALRVDAEARSSSCSATPRRTRSASCTVARTEISG